MTIHNIGKQDDYEIVKVKPVITTHAINSLDSVSKNNYSFTRYYSNLTDDNISIIHRNNLVTVKHSYGCFNKAEGDFFINDVYTFNTTKCIDETIKNIEIHGLNKHTDKDLNYIHQTLINEKNNNNRLNSTIVTISKKIPYKTIKLNNLIYIEECDILITSNPYNSSIIHPYSKANNELNKYKDFLEDNNVTGFLIELISNKEPLKDRYIKLNNIVQEITSKVYSNKDDGCYITRFNNSPVGIIDKDVEYYPLEDLEKIGIYSTREEAEHSDRTDSNHQILMNEKDKELLEIKKDYEHTKFQNELELERYKNEVNKLKNQYEIQKQNNSILKDDIDKERIKFDNNIEKESTIRKYNHDEEHDLRKHYYENKAYERKDTSESLKTNLFILTCLVTLGMQWYNKK